MGETRRQATTAPAAPAGSRTWMESRTEIDSPANTLIECSPVSDTWASYAIAFSSAANTARVESRVPIVIRTPPSAKWRT
jgi:hypothetical protein